MIGQYREMFVTATSFLECADYCFNAENSFVKGFHTPAIVNYAFACEVYLKLLLLHQGIKIKRHELLELFKQLPEEKQKQIMTKIFNNRIWLTDAFGKNELYNISDAFIKWRYRYDSSTLSCNVGFLQELAKVLRDECCELIFGSTWNNLKGEI